MFTIMNGAKPNLHKIGRMLIKRVMVSENKMSKLKITATNLYYTNTSFQTNKNDYDNKRANSMSYSSVLHSQQSL